MLNLRRLRLFCLFAALTVGFSVQGWAGLLIEFDSFDIQSGGSAILTATIAGDPGTELLTVGNLQVRLQQAVGTTSTLEFGPTSDTTNLLFPPPTFPTPDSPPPNLATTSTPNDTLNGGFTTLPPLVFPPVFPPPLPGPPVAIPTSTVPFIQWELTHFFPLGDNPLDYIGDSFTVDVTPAPTTLFLNSVGAPVSFSSTPGTITITGASVQPVPEPSSLTVFAVGILVFLKRRKRSAATSGT